MEEHQFVAADVLCLPIVMVNVCLVGAPGAGWALVDTALTGSADRIAGAAEERFGADARPEAIILTHGHFDHVGAVRELAQRWEVPVYAHPLEMPYLMGQADYPPPDPTVGGGLMSLISPLYPRRGIDIREHVRALPADGTIPGMPGWRWIHTPGHTPGHVSFFRERDRVLISGDAFITVQQESAIAVMTQEKEVHGPPAYFTTDWAAARESVQALRALHPQAVAPGHGQPMDGDELSRELDVLADHFDQVAVPESGRYVYE